MRKVIAGRQTQLQRRTMLIGIGALAASMSGARMSHAAPPLAGGDVSAPAGVARAALYEEDPADPQGKRYGGGVAWMRDTRADAARMLETAIRASITIPDLPLVATWTLRRNNDRKLPASHTIDVLFKLPPNSPYGVADVRGVIMKPGENVLGAPLNGIAVKVTADYFLFGLSADDAQRKANVARLEDDDWIDMPIVLDNGRRAILSFEKGEAGRRVFAQVFAEWEGPPRPAPPEDVVPLQPPMIK